MFFTKEKLYNMLVYNILKKNNLHYSIYILDTDLQITYSFVKNIYISKSVYNYLNIYELIALILHEIGHKKHYHSLKSVLLIMILLVINIGLQILIPNIFILFIIFFISVIICISANRYMEYQADLFSAKLFDKYSTISILMYFKNKSSFTHPSYLARIKNIKNKL